MTEEELIAATVAFMTAQGIEVVQNAKVAATSPAIYRLTLRQAEKTATTQVAFAYTHDNVYRAVASWTNTAADESITDRFINSFVLSNQGADPL